MSAEVKPDKLGIRTMEVGINVVTLGSKNLKNTILRQIKTEDIVDMENFCLKGIAWGSLNIFFGDDKDKTHNHFWHILWQDNNELRRCVIPHCHEFNSYNLSWATKRAEEIRESLVSIQHRSLVSIQHSMDQGYEPYVDYVDRISRLKTELYEQLEDIEKEKYRRDVWIPAYTELVKDFHDLPHFFIV